MKISDALPQMCGSLFDYDGSKFRPLSKEEYTAAFNKIIANSFDSNTLFSEVHPEDWLRGEPLLRELNSEVVRNTFYITNLGYIPTLCSPEIVYWIGRSILLYGTPLLLSKLVDEATYNRIFSKSNYADGENFESIVRAYYIDNWEAVKRPNLTGRNGNSWDIYLEQLDTVIIVPDLLKNSLPLKDLVDVLFKDEEREYYLYDRKLYEFGGYLGVRSKVNDMRDLI